MDQVSQIEKLAHKIYREYPPVNNWNLLIAISL